MPEETQEAAVNWLHSRYADFGPTLACEKLVEEHGLKISVESVRKIMIEEGIWKPKKAGRRPFTKCGNGEHVLMNWFRLMDLRTIGLKGEQQNAVCWYSSMMQLAD